MCEGSPQSTRSFFLLTAHKLQSAFLNMFKWGLGGTSADQAAAAVGGVEGEGADVQTGHGHVFLFEKMAKSR